MERYVTQEGPTATIPIGVEEHLVTGRILGNEDKRASETKRHYVTVEFQEFVFGFDSGCWWMTDGRVAFLAEEEWDPVTGGWLDQWSGDIQQW